MEINVAYSQSTGTSPLTYILFKTLRNFEHSHILLCDVMCLGEVFPSFRRHHLPSKRWKPLSNWHSVTSRKISNLSNTDV